MAAVAIIGGYVCLIAAFGWWGVAAVALHVGVTVLGTWRR